MDTELWGSGGGIVGEPDRWSDRLSEYLDGGLSPADVRGLVDATEAAIRAAAAGSEAMDSGGRSGA